MGVRRPCQRMVGLENWEGWACILSLCAGSIGVSLGRRGGLRVRVGTKGFVFGMLGNLCGHEDGYEIPSNQERRHEVLWACSQAVTVAHEAVKTSH